MPEFSACYFCGTALDAPLAEYPVVPEALHPSADQQRTVVLCPTCRRKLGAVVDAVIEAIDDAPAAESVQRDLSDASDDEETNDGISVAEVDDHRAVDESTERPSDADDDGGFEFEEDAESESEAIELDERHESDDESTEESVVEEASTDSVDVGDESADRTDGDVGTDIDDETATGEAPDDETAANEASDAGATDDDDAQLTALEYNKVMRLLQNRDFPVDREEFKIVATNAYEIGDDEFDAIIDAAADRGLIGLDGGDIVES